MFFLTIFTFLYVTAKYCGYAWLIIFLLKILNVPPINEYHYESLFLWFFLIIIATIIFKEFMLYSAKF